MGLEKKESTDDSRAEKIQSRIEERAAAKKSKDYARADAIRAELLREGVVLEDTPQGTNFRILADQLGSTCLEAVTECMPLCRKGDAAAFQIASDFAGRTGNEGSQL